MDNRTSTRSNQVKAYLLDFIVQNHLKRNDQLPSESAIAKTLGVSRNTLREAYISLENEGIIVRRHGIGTFVATSPVIRDSLNEFLPFAQIIQAGGYTPGFETLSMSFEHPPAEVYDVLNVSPSLKLRQINRIVLADEQPVIYVEDYMTPALEALQLDWDAVDGNVVNFLANALETPLHQIQSSIRAAGAPAAIAAILNLPDGAPVLSVRSTIFAIDNMPVTYSKILFNSSIVELNIVRMIRTP